MKFNEYKGLDLPKTAEEVLEKWSADDTFGKSLSTREGHPAFVFYEGPPSANGMPGIHHVLARTIKDTICRYKTQRGFLVHRKAGWDTHGLPVELGVEKKLGITKEDIGRKISIEEYNRTCREAVMEFTDAWRDLTRKMGYWVNMDDPYITYDNKYIETLWYLLKQLYDKGLLYKGYTIQPYSPAAGTGLSTHELNQPGCYRDVKDTTCTAQFEVVRDAKSEKLFDGASRMEHLAINLQDMAKLQSSDFELHRAPVGVRALFESAIAEMGAELEGYKIEWNLEENLPPLDGDEEYQPSTMPVRSSRPRIPGKARCAKLFPAVSVRLNDNTSMNTARFILLDL